MAVIALSVISVALLTAGPEILGDATNALFVGFVGRLFPAGQTQAQVLAGLRPRVRASWLARSLP